MTNKEQSKLKVTMSSTAKKWSEQLWDKLIIKVAKLNSEKEVKSILEKLITEDEKNMILRRLAAISLIRSGNSYRIIGEILWLSPNTVSTIKKNILGGHANYKSYLGFYKGPTKRGSLNIHNQKSYSDNFMELISLAGKIFEPFARKGLGVKGERQ